MAFRQVSHLMRSLIKAFVIAGMLVITVTRRKYQMAMRRFSTGLSLCGLLVTSGFVPAYGSNLESFAGTIGGTSLCTTGGPPPQIGPFFGSQGFGIGSNGNGISDCGLTGSIVDHNAPLGTLTASNGVTAAVPGGQFTGTATGSANYGTSGATSHGIMTGITSSSVFSEASGFGLWEDNLTFSSPSQAPGSAGSVVYTFTINAGLTTPGPNPPFFAQELGSLALKQDSFFQGNIFTSNAGTGSTGTILGGTSYPGFTTGPGFVTGTGKFPSVQIPFTWGLAVDLKVGIIVGVFPTTGSTSDANETETLTGIQLFGANGQPVADFSIGSSSGAQYGAAGILSEPVPEPATALLVTIGLAGIATRARRQRV